MNLEQKKRFIINIFFIFIWFVIFFLIARYMLSFLFPVLFSVLLAAIVQKPSMKISQKTKIKKEKIAVFLTLLFYFLFFAFLLLIMFFIIKFCANSVKILPEHIEKITHKTESVYSSFKGLFENFSPFFSKSIETFKNKVLNLTSEMLSSKFTNFLGSFLKQTPSAITTFIVTLVLGCYIAKDFDKLKRFFSQIISKNAKKTLMKIKSIVVDNVFKMIGGYLILSLIIFVLLWLVFLILDIKYGYLIALIIAIIDFFPILGVGIVLIPWSIIALLNGNFFIGITLAITYVFSLSLRNFLEPKIISKRIGISPLLTLLSMFLGLKLFGVGGMILFPLVLIVLIKYFKEEYSL